MSFGAILVLSIGLAMDATAVAAARGMAASRIRLGDVLLVGLVFGAFQALMPLLGWAIGSKVGPYAQAWDHWIAFVVLGGIGAKMLWESRAHTNGNKAATQRTGPPDIALHVLLMLAVATSIDALAVGITLPMLNAPLVLSLSTIGITTATLSALGMLVGKRVGAALGPKVDAFGGILLIVFGTKILIEHLSA